MARFWKVLAYLSLIAISVLAVGIYILGGFRYLGDHEKNSCDMTYMFEYPQYMRIRLHDDIESKYPKYGLYAYAESFLAGRVQRKKFDGIPVLFIPGNAGSHEQVRSLASVSFRMSLKKQTPFHFEYFTVSLAEGYSALHGGILEDQKAYVSKCIDGILKLYTERVKKVILIGHSMGGIIAKAALLHNNYSNSSRANVLITLATPHVPNFIIDKTLANFYHDINENTWRLKEMGINVISIGGGPRDYLVTPQQIIDPYADINVISNSIPDVWKSTDHLSILWCKQLVIALVRALFSSVDIQKRLMFDEPEKRLHGLNYHLISRYSGKHMEHYESFSKFQDNSIWIEDSRHFFTWKDQIIDSKENKNRKFVYLMLPIKVDDVDHLSLDAINLEVKDWLFGCLAKSSIESRSSKVCESGWNLTNLTRILPDHQGRNRKSLDLNLKELQKKSAFSHIVLKIPNTKIPIVHVDLYSRYLRTKKMLKNPSLGSSIFWPTPKEIIRNSEGSAIRNFVNLEGISDVINIQILKMPTESEKPKLRQIILELDESKQSVLVRQFRLITEENLGKIITLRIQTKNLAELRIISDPSFKFEARIQRGGIIDRISCIVRDRWNRLYPVLVSFSLLLIGIRMDPMKRTMPTIIITILGSVVLDLAIESIVSLGILVVLAVSTCITVAFWGPMMNNSAAKFLARATRLLPATWFNWLIREEIDFTLSRLWSLLVLILACSSCWALIMVISVFVYLLKLVHLYDDYVEELLISSFRTITTRFDGLLKKWRNKKGSGEENYEDTKENILNHLVIFMTWTITAVNAVPTTLVWAKNFSYETRLSTEDLTMMTSWIIITTSGSLCLVRIPTSFSGSSAKIVQVMSVFQRLVGWTLFLSAGLENPVIYQWLITPTVALSITCIVGAATITPDPKKTPSFLAPSEETQEQKNI